ncbi:hypothetical protein Fmac_008007 [Flemingia macrophylla]|uniref:Uncharacterized protein n=1 Tax=Flemingia macrophylla TaxID=520843 RepID=A0ABD1MX24_9FABA
MLHQEGFKLDCFLYNTIMKGYCVLSQGSNETIEVYNNIKEEALCRDERVAKAYKVFGYTVESKSLTDVHFVAVSTMALVMAVSPQTFMAVMSPQSLCTLAVPSLHHHPLHPCSPYAAGNFNHDGVVTPHRRTLKGIPEDFKKKFNHHVHSSI